MPGSAYCQPISLIQKQPSDFSTFMVHLRCWKLWINRAPLILRQTQKYLPFPGVFFLFLGAFLGPEADGFLLLWFGRLLIRPFALMPVALLPAEYSPAAARFVTLFGHSIPLCLYAADCRNADQDQPLTCVSSQIPN